MAQLVEMAKKLKRLIHLNEVKEDEQLKESHPLCPKIKSKTWEGEDIYFSKYDGINDPRMHITIFEEATCSLQHDANILVRFF